MKSLGDKILIGDMNLSKIQFSYNLGLVFIVLGIISVVMVTVKLPVSLLKSGDAISDCESVCVCLTYFTYRRFVCLQFHNKTDVWDAFAFVFPSESFGLNDVVI